MRRAFGSAFSDDEVDDIYSAAWLGVLNTLERRQEQLDDEELRRYLLASVANQAAREIRRRGRHPAAPLEEAVSVPDEAELPEERAARSEDAQLARDVLASLPARRRAVLMFRYGWDLEPQQVCALVRGLTPRAYRKEVTRGVDEVARKLRMAEAGEWCASREPLLKALVAGTADSEQRLQAEQHLAHCRPCSDFVCKLGAQLHDVGGGVGLLGVLDAVDGGRLGLADRAGALLDRGKDAVAAALGRGPDGAADAAAGVAASGGTRGAGTAGAGVLAKLAGVGGLGKTVAACVGTGAAAATCVAAGVVPGVDLAGAGDRDRPAEERSAEEVAVGAAEEAPAFIVDQIAEVAPPADPGNAGEPESQPSPEPDLGSEPDEEQAEEGEPASETPLAEPAPPAVEFEPVGAPVAPAASSAAAGNAPSGGGSSGGSSSGGDSSGGSGSDFGP